MSDTASDVSSRAGGTVYVVGSANIDIVFAIERLPRRGETIAGGQVSVVPGGKGANQACAAARMGAPARLISQLGTDSFALILHASLHQAGVDVSGVGETTASTGCAWIAVYPDGENSIVVSSGANATLTPQVAVNRLGALSIRDVVLLQLETPLPTVAAVLSFARERGAMTILDPAPAQVLPADLLGAVDLLTPNQSEAALLSGSPNKEIGSHADAGPIAVRLRQSGPRSVLIKMSAHGCVLSSGPEWETIEGHQVKAVDTTAAGDVFNGALAARIVMGASLAEAAAFANAAAALSVTRAGAQTSIPTKHEVDDFRRRRSSGQSA